MLVMCEYFEKGRSDIKIWCFGKAVCVHRAGANKHFSRMGGGPPFQISSFMLVGATSACQKSVVHGRLARS